MVNILFDCNNCVKPLFTAAPERNRWKKNTIGRVPVRAADLELQNKVAIRPATHWFKT